MDKPKEIKCKFKIPKELISSNKYLGCLRRERRNDLWENER